MTSPDYETSERGRCPVCGGHDIEEQGTARHWVCLECYSGGYLSFDFKRWCWDSIAMKSPEESHCPQCASVDLREVESHMTDDPPWTGVNCLSCEFKGEREYVFRWATADLVTSQGEMMAADDDKANSV